MPVSRTDNQVNTDGSSNSTGLSLGQVTLTNGVLTISGEKQDTREEKNKDYSVSERRYGSFVRSFRIPEGVDQDKVTSRFEKGVLTLTLPKLAAAPMKPSRKIEIGKRD